MERKLETISKVLDEKSLSQLSLEELRGYEWVRLHEEVSKKQYADHFRFNYKKAQRHLALFVKLEFVRTVGKGPSTKYILKTK